MYNVMGRPAWLPAVIFDSCKHLLSAVLTVSIILRSASLCIKRTGLYYYFYWPTYIGYVYKSMHAYIYTYIYMSYNKILTWRPDYQGLCLGLETWYQGLGLGLETWWPRSWSWSRDLVAKVLVLVSRPGHQGLGLGLEFFSKVLITSLLKSGL